MTKLSDLEIFNLKAQSRLQTMALSHYKDIVQYIKSTMDKNSLFLDQAILAISSGAIGLFFAFNQEVYRAGLVACEKLFLVSSIILFTLAIASVLISFYLSQKSLIIQSKQAGKWHDNKTKTIKRLDIKIPFEEQADLLDEISENPSLSNSWGHATNIFNLVAGIFLFSGILSAITFFFLISF